MPRGCSGYMVFAAYKRRDIARSDPDASLGAWVMQLVSEEWWKLTDEEKREYKRQADTGDWDQEDEAVHNAEEVNKADDVDKAEAVDKVEDVVKTKKLKSKGVVKAKNVVKAKSVKAEDVDNARGCRRSSRKRN